MAHDPWLDMRPVPCPHCGRWVRSAAIPFPRTCRALAERALATLDADTLTGLLAAPPVDVERTDFTCIEHVACPTGCEGGRARVADAPSVGSCRAEPEAPVDPTPWVVLSARAYEPLARVSDERRSRLALGLAADQPTIRAYCAACGIDRPVLDRAFGEPAPALWYLVGIGLVALGGCVIEPDRPARACARCREGIVRPTIGELGWYDAMTRS